MRVPPPIARSACCLVAVAATLLVATTAGAQYSLTRIWTHPNAFVEDRFAWDIAGDGTDVFIGAPARGAALNGSAFRFSLATGALLTTSTSPTPSQFDSFGASVFVLGSYLVVRASGDDTAATDAGAVHIFDKTSGSFIRTILAPAPGASDNFAGVFATLGSNLLIGAPPPG
jgi:hypothetical protein